MSRRLLSSAPALLAVLAACPGDDGPPDNLNPPVLWLALDGSETEVKLAGSEPEPF